MRRARAADPSDDEDGRARVVELDRATVAELRTHRARQAAEWLELGRRPEDSTLVFSWPDDGRCWHPERVSREFDRVVGRIEGLPRIRLHDLRHTWATLALRAGVPVKVVSERLGHSSAMVTLDTYSHTVVGMQAEAAEQVAAMIFGS